MRAAGGGKAGQQHATFIRDAVAVVVLKKEHIRRARDDESAIPRQDTIGEREAIGKDGPLIHPSVAVGVFEHRDNARRLLPFLGPDWVASIFRDEQASLAIEGNRTRRSHQGLRGDKFDT